MSIVSDVTFLLRDIPEPLHRELKVKAAQTGYTMREILLLALEEWLQRRKKERD